MSFLLNGELYQFQNIYGCFKFIQFPNFYEQLIIQYTAIVYFTIDMMSILQCHRYLKLWYFSSMMYMLLFLVKHSTQICPQVNHAINGNFEAFKNLNKFMNATQSFNYEQYSTKNGWYLQNFWTNTTNSSYIVRSYLNKTNVGLQVFNNYNASICQDYSDLEADQMYQVSYTTIIDNNSHDVIHSTLWNGIKIVIKNMKKSKVGVYNMSEVMIVVAQSGINTLCFHNKEVSLGLHKNNTPGNGGGSAGNGGSGGSGGGANAGNGNKKTPTPTTNTTANNTTNTANTSTNATNPTTNSTNSTSSLLSNLVTGTIIDDVYVVKLIKQTAQYQISDPTRVQIVSLLNNTLNSTSNQTNQTNSTNSTNSTSMTNITTIYYKYKITTNFVSINPPSVFYLDKLFIDGVLAYIDSVALTPNNSYVQYSVLLPQVLNNSNPLIKIVLANYYYRTLCGELVYLDCTLGFPLALNSTIISNNTQIVNITYNNSIPNTQNNIPNTPIINQTYNNSILNPQSTKNINNTSNNQKIDSIASEKQIFRGLVFSMQMIRTVGFSLVVMQFITLSNILILYIFTDVQIVPDRVKQALEFAAIILLKNGIISNIYQFVTSQKFQNLNAPLEINNQIPENYDGHGSSFKVIDISYNLLSFCLEDLIIMIFNILKFIGMLQIFDYVSRKRSTFKQFFKKIKESADQIILFEIVSPSSVWMILPGFLLSRFGQYISSNFVDKYNFAVIILYPLIFVVFSLAILLTSQMNKSQKNSKNSQKLNLNNINPVSLLNIFLKKKYFESKQDISHGKCKEIKGGLQLDQIIGLVQNFHMIFFGFFIGIQSMALLFATSFLIIMIKIYLLIKIFKIFKWYLNVYHALAKTLQVSIFFIFFMGFSSQKIIPQLSQNQNFKKIFQFFCNSLLYLYIGGLFIEIIYSVVNISYFFISMWKNCLKIHDNSLQNSHSNENLKFKPENIAEILRQGGHQLSQHNKFNQKQPNEILSRFLKNSINLKFKDSIRAQNIFQIQDSNDYNNSYSKTFLDKTIKNEDSQKAKNKKSILVINPVSEIFNMSSVKSNPLPLIITNTGNAEQINLGQQEHEIEQQIYFQKKNNSFEEKPNTQDQTIRQKRRTSSKI